MQCLPPCPAPTRWWWMTVSRPFLYLCLYLWLHAYCFFFFFLPSWLCCPLWFKNSPQTHLWEGFLLCGNFSFPTPSPGQVSIHKSFITVFLFYILSYLLLKRLGCLSVLCQSSEIVLWKLLSSQMIFWWICGGESGLPILSLCHLVTTLSQNNSYCQTGIFWDGVLKVLPFIELEYNVQLTDWC